ncbi:MAG TPA: glycosyltransferase family 4 protein [Candidatus Acidoferrum sp.]|nr:glycosyltransferase family 4 protein [Candidatus Acidoferrum sp.]
MKILVSSINFFPDHSGIALYSTDLAVYFAEQGHDVSMVTGFPYYPKWEKRPEDRKRLFQSDQYKGVKILRGYLYVPKRVTTVKRILHELSFVFFALINFFRAGRQDCIVILSPPLLLGLVGVVFKWLWGAQLVFHIQDLQPDAALSLGMVKPGLLIRTLQRIELFIYKHSSWVATITRGMRERLLDKGVPAEKLALYYNWINVEEASSRHSPGRFLARHSDLVGKFIVAYAGNLGIKQGVDVLVEAAELLQNDPRFQLLIIGEGADRPRLMKIAEAKRLRNLTFLPFLTPSEYIDMLCDVQVSFVAQKEKTGNVFFPSKLLGIMAMSKPLLISADLESELATTVGNGNFGLVVAAGDAKGVAGGIRRLESDSELCGRLGQQGRKAVEFWDRKIVLGDFLKRINESSGRSNSI